MSAATKEEARQRRHKRVRRNVLGSGERPRLCVFRSNKYIYGQLIDDFSGRTLLTASNSEKDLKGRQFPSKVEASKEVGRLIATRAKEAGISKVVFDRAGYLYHGRVKALADGAREGGLEF